MTTEKKSIQIEKRDAVAQIVFNRPEKKNALNRATIREILDALEELRGDDSVAVVLTTGVGDSYCAGRDLTEFPRDPSSQERYDRRSLPRAYHIAEVIRNYPKVTIAVVNGYCLGAGITLLLPHDLAIASDKAVFGLPEVMRGFLPYPLVATLFRAIIPTKFAFEMILTGRNWSAQKAFDVGLVNRVEPHAQFQEEAWKWGAEIARWDKLTLQYCKMAAHASMEAASVPMASEIAWLMQQEHSAINQKAFEGMRAFLDRKELKAT
jgi:enoyl-CoA hydratase/carnithine racemase